MFWDMPEEWKREFLRAMTEAIDKKIMAIPTSASPKREWEEGIVGTITWGEDDDTRTGE